MSSAVATHFMLGGTGTMTEKEKVSSIASLKPDARLAKTSCDGRVVYENVDYQFLTGEDMRKVGERMAKEFPSFTIWVTGGAYRGYNVAYQADLKKKIISIDFYSVHPGLKDVSAIINILKIKLRAKGMSP